MLAGADALVSGCEAVLFSTSVLPMAVSVPSGATAYRPIEPLPAFAVKAKPPAAASQQDAA